MRRAEYTLIAALAGCSFPGPGGGNPGTADAPLDEPADAPVLTAPDANPAQPDARVDARPDASPPDAEPSAPDAAPDAAQATCPGYSPVTGAFPAGATYRGFSTGAQWQTARGNCQDDGGDLVVIDNEAEASGVAGLVDDSSPYFWIGVYDPNGSPDSNFTSVRGGTPPWLPWGGGEPSGGNQDCVLLSDDGSPHEFFDWGCGAPQDYVCECLPP